jgi:hypothetical protein
MLFKINSFYQRESSFRLSFKVFIYYYIKINILLCEHKSLREDIPAIGVILLSLLTCLSFLKKRCLVPIFIFNNNVGD